MERARPTSPSWPRVVLVLYWACIYLPLIWMIRSSLLTVDGEFTFQWYQQVFSDQAMMEAAARSFLVGIGNAIVSPIIGTLAAVALLKSNFWGRQWMQWMGVVSLALPELIFALALLAWFFILGLQLSLWTVLISHITFTLAFVILIISSRLAQLDKSVIEAAEDLGASHSQVLLKIIVPQLGPALILASALSFLLSFDDFLITFFVSGVGSDTLPVKLYQSLKMGTSPKLSALATMIFLICVGILLIGNSSLFEKRRANGQLRG